MATVTLDDPSATAFQTLRAQASARGLSLDKYLATLADLAERMIPSGQKTAPALSKAEFSQWLRDLSAGMNGLAPLPTDFSRADIYGDHD